MRTGVTAFCDAGEKYLHENFMQPAADGVDATHFR
jgi:cysteine synthase A